jgi:hypothetical protein
MLWLLRVYCKYFVWNKYLKFKNKYSSTRNISNVAFNKNYRTLETGYHPWSVSVLQILACWSPFVTNTTLAMLVQRNNEGCLRNIVAVEKQQVLHISVCVCGWVGGCRCSYKDACVCLRACSLTYPACNAHTLCFLGPLWFHHIFAT